MPELTAAAALALDGAMVSDSGLVRPANEDCAAYILPKPGDPAAGGRAILAVADGMGGHAAGEVASRLACESTLAALSAGAGPTHDLLRRAFTGANAAVLAAAAGEPELRGMGTTLTVLLVEDGRAWLGHVGDSRAYLWREDRLEQLSEDHSLVGELVRRGALSAGAARQHPDRNVIVKALGTGPDLRPAVWRRGLQLREGDVLLLCSDGLTDLVADDAIAESLDDRAPLEICQALVARALAAGGHDNVTVGVFRVVAGNRPAAGPAATATTTRVPAAVLP